VEVKHIENSLRLVFPGNRDKVKGIGEASHPYKYKFRESLIKGRICTIDLLGLTSSDQMFYTYFFLLY